MEKRQQLIIAASIALAALISYAIYTDITRLFPKKDDDEETKD